MKKKIRTTPCIICGEPVEQDKSTSADRKTCKRVEVNGVLEMSKCEIEKNRRYQKKYRETHSAKGNPVSVKNKSVAMSSVKHLAKYQAEEYKRNCLKCGKKFTGVGKYNRVCNYCTIENSRQSHLKGV